MTSLLNLFGGATSGPDNPYARLGFPLNPFRPSHADILSGQAPFYRSYVETELTEVDRWIGDVHRNAQRQPLSVVGNIGAGKTQLIGRVAHLLRQQPLEEKIAVDSLVLSDAGYGKISVGSWLMMSLERLPLPWLKPTSWNPNIMPLLQHLAQAPNLPSAGRMARTLTKIRQQPSTERAELVQYLATWLGRGALTDSQARRLGLLKRVDWEGELIPIVGELLTLARTTSILGTFFLFIDQLEDLFGKGVTPVRRSRVLTDLRALIDVIDAGAPIGLVLSWTPNFDTLTLAHYPALHSRLARKRVNLPLLSPADADGFARTWIEALVGRPEYNPAQQPAVRDLAQAAWTALRSERLLYPPGDKATPRDYLTALAKQVDQRALPSLP